MNTASLVGPGRVPPDLSITWTWDTTYYFVVRAYVGTLESADSEEVSFVARTPEPTTYTISSVAGEHGSISPGGTVVVPKDSDFTVTIIPESGYHVLDVKVDGQSKGAISSYTFSAVTANHTIDASFAIDTYQIAASAGTNGSILPLGTISADHGTSKDYIISSVVGYHVADVLVNGVSMGAINTYTFDQINSDSTIHATFTADKVAIEDNTSNKDTTNPAGTDFSKAMEFGDVQVDHTWTRVNFERTFVTPIVVAGPISLNGGQPAVVRIQNVDTTGFEMRIQEWDYLDGSHVTEAVSYLVMEQGNYTLADGTKIEAAKLETRAADSFQQVAFSEAFNVPPIVMTTITGFNDSNAVAGRVRQISVDGFGYRMQEQEGNVQDHGTENLSYIAWEPSSGAMGDTIYLVEKTIDAVKHDDYCIFFDEPFPSAPTFLADMQTTDGGDTANVRYANKDEFAVDVLIDEEQSRDTETGHTTEVVGYMAFSR